MNNKDDMFSSVEAKNWDAQIREIISELFKLSGVNDIDKTIARLIVQINSGDAEEFGAPSRSERACAAGLIRYAYSSIRTRLLEDIKVDQKKD